MNTTDTTDERMGLPSASEYHRIAACPGYLNLKKQVKDKPAETEDAKSGTRIAAAMATRSPEDLAALSYEETLIFEKLVAGREKIIETVIGKNDRCVYHAAETRLYLKNPIGKIYFSGKPDQVYIYASSDSGKTYGLIIDDKSGRNDVEEAASNMQLRALAVMLQEHHATNTEGAPLDRIFVAINQPFAEKPISIAEYDAGMEYHAFEELELNLRRSELVKELTIPGPHCEYCAARGICSRGQAEVITQVSSAPIAIHATTEQLTKFLEWVDDVDPEKTIEAAKDELKRRIEAGEQVEGWEIKPGRTMEAITDPELVFTRCSESGIDYKSFLKSVKIGKGALQDVLADSLKLKGKDLKNKLTEMLSGAVTESQAATSLKRKK